VPGSEATAPPIKMPDHGAALGAAGPVAASTVLAGRKGRAIGPGAREDIVLVRCVAPCIDTLAVFVQAGFAADSVAQMKVGQVFSDHHAFGVIPGALADSGAWID